jgi:hypothetical protein
MYIVLVGPPNGIQSSRVGLAAKFGIFLEKIVDTMHAVMSKPSCVCHAQSQANNTVDSAGMKKNVQSSK